MDIKSIEKKLINNYLKTLGRYKINNIPINNIFYTIFKIICLFGAYHQRQYGRLCALV